MAEVGRTFLAPSTPAGHSGIATVRVSGPSCPRIYREIFYSEPVHRLASCRDYRDLSGEIVDRVLVTFFTGPKSFTGDDVLEISCHGNPLIVERIVTDLIDRGCLPADPGEFTRRAFWNGKLDLSQAEAVADLIHARSWAALRCARRQLSGALGHILSGVREDLLSILAAMESAIDFSDEGLSEPKWEEFRGTVLLLRKKILSLAETFRNRSAIERGVGVVLVGAPNGGKSSLLNALLGRERALVSPTAGTTRDFLEEPIRLGPWLIRIIDTAGISESASELDLLSMERSREKLTEAELIFWVVDGSQKLGNAEKIGKDLTGRTGAILLNKRDLPQKITQSHSAFRALGWPVWEVSAKISEDSGRIRDLLQKLLEEKRILPDGEDLAVNFRQMALLREAAEALERAEKLLRENFVRAECVTEELNCANKTLAAVVGEGVSEKVLDRIFSTFCIGK
ncbi:MAG: tRNA uridine-5-carboxymethylaminomethyl(34) synthesis GTPase MnmE [Puniceicoccales bacterium]|jgi:tRNA modification GTPase|nr:tRNA uridine-5-carboxymethylaminomethyl(34) synthesis GTPase MnmE [Puniceicoccales bacterium]